MFAPVLNSSFKIGPPENGVSEKKNRFSCKNPNFLSFHLVFFLTNHFEANKLNFSLRLKKSVWLFYMAPTVFLELLKNHSFKGIFCFYSVASKPNIVLSLLLEGNLERNITAALEYV